MHEAVAAVHFLEGVLGDLHCRYPSYDVSTSGATPRRVCGRDEFFDLCLCNGCNRDVLSVAYDLHSHEHALAQW